MCSNDWVMGPALITTKRGSTSNMHKHLKHSMELFCGRELITGTGSSIPLCTIWQSPWKMLKWTWSRASVQTKQTKLQVHLKRDAYLFHRCSLSAPLCHNDHIYSSCLLKQESDKFQKLKTNCGRTVINTIQKYKDHRRDSRVFSLSRPQWKHTVTHRCDTNHQTGLHKPPTTPWTSSQPPLCSLGFYLGATSGPAFCTCTPEVKGAVAVKTMKAWLLPSMKKYRRKRAKHEHFWSEFSDQISKWNVPPCASWSLEARSTALCYASRYSCTCQRGNYYSSHKG